MTLFYDINVIIIKGILYIQYYLIVQKLQLRLLSHVPWKAIKMPPTLSPYLHHLCQWVSEWLFLSYNDRFAIFCKSKWAINKYKSDEEEQQQQQQ